MPESGIYRCTVEGVEYIIHCHRTQHASGFQYRGTFSRPNTITHFTYIDNGEDKLILPQSLNEELRNAIIRTLDSGAEVN